MPSSISKLPRIPSAHGAGVREPALATRRSSLPMMPERTTSAVVGDPVANGEDVRDAARASRHSSLSTVAERVMSLVDGDPGPLPTSWGGRPVAGGEGVLDSACAIRRSSLKGVLDSARDSLRSGSLSMRPGRSMTTVSVAKIDQFHFEKEGASYRLQGNGRYEGEAHRRKREKLKESKYIRRSVLALWAAMGKSEEDTASREEYITVHTRISCCVAPDLSPEEKQRVAEEEWETDSGGKTRMTFNQFDSSMTELADMWTEDVSEVEYKYFLDKLHARITKPAAESLADSADVKIRFVLRTEEEIAARAPRRLSVGRRRCSIATAAAAAVALLEKPRAEYERSRNGPPDWSPAGDQNPGEESKRPLPKFICKGHGKHRRLLSATTGSGKIRVFSQREEAESKCEEVRKLNMLKCRTSETPPASASFGIMGLAALFVTRGRKAVSTANASGVSPRKRSST